MSTEEEFKAPQNWGETVGQAPDPATRYRTLWRRMGALWIDTGILTVPEFFISWLLSSATGATLTDELLSTLFVLTWNVLFIGLKGTTPGKWVFGLRVVPLDETQKPGLRRGFLRGLLVAVSFVLYFAVFVGYWVQGQLAATDNFMIRPFDRPVLGTVFVAVLVMSFGDAATALFSDRRRTVHDFIAGTVVVKSKAPSVGGAVMAVIASTVIIFGGTWLLVWLRH